MDYAALLFRLRPRRTLVPTPTVNGASEVE